MTVTTDANLARRRGDTYPVAVEVKDLHNAPINITGRTFRLAVNRQAAPDTTADQVLDVAGTITDAAAGKVEFAMTGAGSVAPGKYYYEVQMTAAGGIVTTILAGAWDVRQDIVK